jgi:hypothetical protein
MNTTAGTIPTLTQPFHSLLTLRSQNRLLRAPRLHPTPRRDGGREAARRRCHPPRQGEPLRVVTGTGRCALGLLAPRGAVYIPVLPTRCAIWFELGQRSRRRDRPHGGGAGHGHERVDRGAEQPQQYCRYQAHCGPNVAGGRRVSIRAYRRCKCAALTRVAVGQ